MCTAVLYAYLDANKTKKVLKKVFFLFPRHTNKEIRKITFTVKYQLILT